MKNFTYPSKHYKFCNYNLELSKVLYFGVRCQNAQNTHALFFDNYNLELSKVLYFGVQCQNAQNTYAFIFIQKNKNSLVTHGQATRPMVMLAVGHI
jgi:hypothetical protein